ncbi:MAG: ornithine carbamoyltransferase [Nitrososphaerales archaeon]|nr:ornithine carbamoyltransferase [Nitrososphaerales archaeon]
MIKGKDVLTLMELSTQEIEQILNLADRLKRETSQGIYRPLLANRTLCMIFQKPSTRTRVSFEAGMFELGGYTITLTSSEMQLSRGETIEDTARTLSRYVDILAARVFDHNDIVRLAKAATIPVINALSDKWHPCQILGDLQTIREVKGRLKGLKLAWVGDGNNVCNTLLIGCAKMGIDMVVAHPPGYGPLKEALDEAYRCAEESGAKISVTEDPKVAVKDADIVATDTFVSMGKDDEREERMKVFLPHYQVNAKLMSLAKPDAVFMHCLPAKRGEEVTDDVIDGPRSIVWEEAENRKHTEKALLCLLLLDEKNLI